MAGELIVPLKAIASQTVEVNLANQPCQIHIYQLRSGLYMDLYVNNSLIIGGVICQNKNRIVRDVYLGFIGDFVFIDTEGDNDPDFTGLGTRFSLAYLPAAA